MKLGRYYLRGMKKKPRIARDILFTDIADKGRAVGRNENGKAIFAEGVIPGDVANVLLTKNKDGYAEGRAMEITTRSPLRVEPFCQHFEVCGGCKWQEMDYATQLVYKQKLVENALSRIGKVEVGAFLPILGAENDRYYRNKIEYGFSVKKWLTQAEVDSKETFVRPGLGFHKAGAFDKVIDIEFCHLMDEPSNALRNAIKREALAQGLEFWDPRPQTGFIRQVMFRLCSTGQLMVVFAFTKHDMEQIKPFLDALLSEFGQITTMVYCINNKMNDFMFDLDMITYAGPGYVEEVLGGLRFKIGPKSFFQTNTAQGTQLYEVAADFARLTGQETVYDLYTGTGSIALYVAKHCKHVVGIEEIPDAISDAKENMRMNDIENATFYAGDVKDVLSPEFVARHGAPDVVITDPPRAGMHPKAVQFLLDLAAPRIVYVSCNPATQARDLQVLSEKYTVVRSQAVDMFPHTHHVENVVELALKG
jgi:23S rRNA (uracil1939-C5)-methyltransferase